MNGAPLDKAAFKRNSGFVTQNSVFLDALTVRTPALPPALQRPRDAPARSLRCPAWRSAATGANECRQRLLGGGGRQQQSVCPPVLSAHGRTTHPHPQVRETLVYTAFLRLSRDLSFAQKRKRAERVLAQVGSTTGPRRLLAEAYFFISAFVLFCHRSVRR